MSTGRLLEFYGEGEWHSKVECDKYGKTTRFAFESAHYVEVDTFSPYSKDCKVVNWKHSYREKGCGFR